MVKGKPLGVIKQIPSSETETGLSEMQRLCKSRAELLGYDSEKNRISNSSGSRMERISKVVSILVHAKKSEIMPICKLLLRQFIKDPGIQRSTFLSGTEADRDIKPMEMKYASLRLLGLSESQIYRDDKYGFVSNKASDRLTLSPLFKGVVDRVRLERSLYPLENPDGFPELTQALRGIVPPFRAEDIFKRDKIPPLLSWEEGETQSKLPLDATLSILRMALDGLGPKDIAGHVHGLSAVKVDEKEVGDLLSTGNTPFSGTIITAVEEKQKERLERNKSHELKN
jgi:hypothetical protein